MHPARLRPAANHPYYLEKTRLQAGPLFVGSPLGAVPNVPVAARPGASSPGRPGLGR